MHILSFCIACGCHEAAACPHDPTGVAESCWWLRYDGAAGLGCCSACEDQVGLFDRMRAERRLELQPTLIVGRFTRQLEDLFAPEDREAWLHGAQIPLDGKSAAELIRSGKDGLMRVHALLDQIRTGAFT